MEEVTATNVVSNDTTAVSAGTTSITATDSEKATKEIDLTIDLVFDKGSKLKQRNDLFDGTEVIVGTTKRICELYFQNGFNIAKLKLFIVLKLSLYDHTNQTIK